MSEGILLFGDGATQPSLHWRTGFLAPDPAVYVEVDGRGTLLVSSMEFGRARKEARTESVRSYDDFNFALLNREGGEGHAYSAMIATLLEELGIERVRVDPSFPVSLARGLESRDIEVLADAPLFSAERRAKRPDEQEAVGRSQAAAQAAMSRAKQVLAEAETRDGMLFWQDAPLTSAVVVGELEMELLRHGCGAPDGTIVAGGPGGADPHTSDTGHLAAGEPVIIDIFPQHKTSRYWGDITRTFVVGEPAPRWLEMYAAVKAAQQAALDTIRAGVNGRDVHLAVCQTLYDAGFSTLVEGFKRPDVPTMIHGTGHGVGLQIHESPRVSDTEVQLVEGDIVTIEPGLYDPAIGGVRLEDTVVVTAGGHRNLTDYPLDWKP
ncbi:MAG: Xaa-Pro aminopeptidase [Chloroflexota bacterium]|nr:Xaa-Pro aminopeptidase [Chloroflexota bacterium]